MPRPATSPRPGKLSESGAKETGAESPLDSGPEPLYQTGQPGPLLFSKVSSTRPAWAGQSLSSLEAQGRVRKSGNEVRKRGVGLAGAPG